MHLNLFAHGCGHHGAAWRHPSSPVDRLDEIDTLVDLARTAERGTFDAVFLADGHAAGGLVDAPRWTFEPMTALSAVARATERIGLVATVSASFTAPFHAARQLASLDRISHGRVGWNVVTSMFDAEARNYGMDRLPEHTERYARADEFVQVVQALWDSWDDDAVRADREGMYADPDRVRAIDHDGEHFRVDGPLSIPRPPQGHPVLFQAGASEPGRDLAARRAEAIYAVASDTDSARRYSGDIRRRADAAGRDGRRIAVLPGLVCYVGSTEREAREIRRELDELLPVETSLRQLETFIGRDCSGWDLDAPVPPLPPLEEFTGPKGRYATILRIIETERPTLRELLGRLAAGGGHCMMVGTPEQVADEMERWVVHGGVDGFNLMPPALPAGLDDFVDQVVPVLRERGLFRKRYEHTTLRGHLGLERPLAGASEGIGVESHLS